MLLLLQLQLQLQLFLLALPPPNVNGAFFVCSLTNYLYNLTCRLVSRHEMSNPQYPAGLLLPSLSGEVNIEAQSGIVA